MLQVHCVFHSTVLFTLIKSHHSFVVPFSLNHRKPIVSKVKCSIVQERLLVMVSSIIIQVFNSIFGPKSTHVLIEAVVFYCVGTDEIFGSSILFIFHFGFQ